MALVFGLAVAVIVLASLLAFCCHREHTKSLVRESVSGNSSDSTNPTDPSSAPPHSPMALSPIAEAPAAETAVMVTAATAARHSVLWDRLSGVGQRLFRPVVVAEPGPQPLPVFKDQTRHCTAAASAEMMAVIPNRLRRARLEASLGEGRPEFPPYRATTPSSLTTPTTVGGCMRSDRSDPPCDKEFRALTDKDDLASANSMPMVTAVAMSKRKNVPMKMRTMAKKSTCFDTTCSHLYACDCRNNMNVFITDVLLPVKMAVLITLWGPMFKRKKHVCIYYMALPTVQVHKFANGRSIGQALRTSHTNLSCSSTLLSVFVIQWILSKQEVH
jgi:hypothetical protein